MHVNPEPRDTTNPIQFLLSGKTLKKNERKSQAWDQVFREQLNIGSSYFENFLDWGLQILAQVLIKI